MALIFFTYLLPRYNWERERRLFGNFLDYYGECTQRLQEQLSSVQKSPGTTRRRKPD